MGIGIGLIFFIELRKPVSKCYLFADDVQLMCLSDDMDALAGDFRKTCMWTATWDLS